MLVVELVVQVEVKKVNGFGHIVQMKNLEVQKLLEAHDLYFGMYDGMKNGKVGQQLRTHTHYQKIIYD